MKNVLAVLTFTLCASTVQAEPPVHQADHDALTELVEKKVLTPLKKVEAKRSKFSRSLPVPAQRRVRLLSEAHEVDMRGKEFVRFAVDERRGYDEESAWREARIVGCAYLGEGKVFVLRGEDYLPAATLLGKDVNAPPGVCRSAAQAAAPSAEVVGERS